MGDRSPKAIEQKKKQAEAEKKKQQANAFSKAHPSTGELGKKGK
jgi:hypothetical protein